MKYGISSKDYSKNNYYIKKFESDAEANEWLNTEEYDFRIRELYDTLEDLINDNAFVRESLDDCNENPDESLTMEDYVEMVDIR